jgi:hypothetical protein
MTLLTVLIAQAATLLERYVRMIVYVNACVIVCVQEVSSSLKTTHSNWNDKQRFVRTSHFT